MKEQEAPVIGPVSGVFLIGLAIVWGKQFLSEYPPIMNAFGMLIASTIFLIPIVLLLNGIPSVLLSIEVSASALLMAIFSTAISYLLYFEILVRPGSENLMLVILLIPPIAIGLSYIFLGQRLGSDAGYGVLLIAIGLIIIDGRVDNRLAGKPQLDIRCFRKQKHTKDKNYPIMGWVK